MENRKNPSMCKNVFKNGKATPSREELIVKWIEIIRRAEAGKRGLFPNDGELSSATEDDSVNDETPRRC